MDKIALGLFTLERTLTMCKRFKILQILSICLLVGTGSIWADEPIKRGAEPSIEEYLRRQLRKLDRWNVMQLLRTERDVDAKQKKRAKSSSNPEELAILAEDEDSGVRYCVAANRHTPLDVQLLLAEDPEPIVRSGIALTIMNNPRTGKFERTLTERIGLRLADDDKPLVRLALSSNRYLPDSVYDALAGDGDPLIRHQLAENLTTPKVVLEKLVQDSDEKVQVAALKHRNLPSVWLVQMSEDNSPIIRQAVCENINTSINTLDKLATDHDTEVREAVAKHRKTQLETLQQLAGDSDPHVVIAVARHPQADRDILLRLSKFDQEVAIRQIARERLLPLLKGEIREDVLERWESQ